MMNSVVLKVVAVFVIVTGEYSKSTRLDINAFVVFSKFLQAAVTTVTKS